MSEIQPNVSWDHASWESGADPISDAEYQSIVQKIFPETWNAPDFILQLKARHLIYYHNKSGAPYYHNGILTQASDCGTGGTNLGGTGTQLKTYGEISKGSELTGIGLAAGHTLGIGSVAGAGAGGIGAAGTTIATIASIAGWATLGAGLILVPLMFISAHHAKAVALEQKDICSATLAANAFLDDIDMQFYADMITEAQAVQGLKNLRDGLVHAMGAVMTATGRTKQSCNAACVYMLYFDGLVELRKSYLYPVHTAGIAAKILPPIASQAISTAGSSVSGFVGTLTGGSVKLSSNAGFLLLMLLLGLIAMGVSRKGVVHA